MNRNQGFSLLELLITVGIILIIASMAIPSLVQSHQSAQESSAVAQLRTINNAERTYRTSNQGVYGNIPALIAQGLLDTRFAGSISGYSFNVTASGANYTANADPTSANSGRFGYYTSPDGVIHYATYHSSNCIPCYPATLSGAAVQ